MGIFSKSADPSTPEYQALVSRWDGFLKKLETRYYEVLQQTEAPLGGIIDGLQYDNVVIINIANGLKNQTVTQLSEKADQAWNKMRGEMDALGFSSGDINSQREKMAVFKYWLEIEYQKFEMSVYARAAHKILDNVKQHIDLNKMHKCTQCAAELPINVYSFMAVNLKCDSCGSVNTYQPDDRIKALEYYVINQLAEEYAFPEKLRSRQDKSAMKEYYKKYYTYLMEHVPDKKEYYQRDLNERLTNPMFSNF